MKFKYCKKCQEDFERMRLGYNARPEDCGNLECHVYDFLNYIAGVLLLIPIVLLLMPVLIYFYFINKLYR